MLGNYIQYVQFSDRVRITNAGGLFGDARPENFPSKNAYINPLVAEGMRILDLLRICSSLIFHILQVMGAEINYFCTISELFGLAGS